MEDYIKIPGDSCLLDFDEDAYFKIIERRGGCSCHISPPCNSCSNPIEEHELNKVGYTYGEK